MRHCEDCGFLETSGYEYPEQYCAVGIQENDPKFGEDGKGCGCRYNLRTLRKKKDEIDHMEYLSYLGYSDYSLMPTMEYTDENIRILEKHRKYMRHALGMDSRKTYTRHGKKFYRPYRNRFITVNDDPYWERMVTAGLAEKEVLSTTPEGKQNILYSATRTGMDWLGQHDGIHIYDEED